MSNFIFSHYCFRSCLLLMCQNEYLWSKGLKANVTINIKFSLWTASTLTFDDNEICHTVKLIDCMVFNPFPNKSWFLRVCSTHLLKTLWEKKKLLVTSNFFFSHSVFYPFRELTTIFIKFKIVIRKLFQFG